MLLSFATTPSLSGIEELDNWADWYVNSTDLALRPNGDLVLTASTTVIGMNGTGFNTFSYYVSAKILLDEATISGTIKWAKTLATPLTAPRLQITANSTIPPTGGSLLGTTIVEGTGLEGNIGSLDGEYEVPYTIAGALLGKTLSVSADPLRARFRGVPSGDTLLTEQISGPNPIKLTVANRHATNVDFEMQGQAPPK